MGFKNKSINIHSFANIHCCSLIQRKKSNIGAKLCISLEVNYGCSVFAYERWVVNAVALVPKMLILDGFIFVYERWIVDVVTLASKS